LNELSEDVTALILAGVVGEEVEMDVAETDVDVVEEDAMTRLAGFP
jgi:hypothetical protein